MQETANDDFDMVSYTAEFPFLTSLTSGALQREHQEGPGNIEICLCKQGA